MPFSVPDQVDRYQAILVKFMNFKDNPVPLYPRGRVFTPEELRSIRPIHIQRWFCLKVFGTPDPAPNQNPTEGRSTSLDYYKKAISYYMPDHNRGWDETNQNGNPTRAREINDLIKAVRKKEVRRQGVPSHARRPMERDEFQQILTACHECEDEDDPMKYWLATYVKYQYHMIARVDDVAHVSAEQGLMPNFQYPFTLKTRLRWPKNVQEERDAPEQIVIASGGGGGAPNQPAAIGPAPVHPPALLSAHPRTLHNLWAEWEIGIGGRKAARNFSAHERGRVKHKFTRRKVFWDAVRWQVRLGHTAEVAIDRIYDLYGRNRSVTYILNALRRDRRLHNGLHPTLR